MDRKYRQRGYQDDPDREKKTKSPPRPRGSGGRVETRFQLTTRCNNCAAQLPINDQIGVTDKCQNCENDLHTCRNCINFDPSARNECIRPIEVRIANKSENNLCTYFEAKLLVEKKGVSAAVRTRVEESRHQAFHDLFKK